MWIVMRSSVVSRWSHNVVEPRQTLPVLANVLLEAQGDTLRMTATDLEVGVRVTGPGQGREAGHHHDLGAQADGDRQGAAGGAARHQGAGERVGRPAVRGRVLQARRA